MQLNVALLLILVATGPSLSLAATDAETSWRDALDLLRSLQREGWGRAPRWDTQARPHHELQPMQDWLRATPRELGPGFDDIRVEGKRSAVASALHAGRRRRQPAPALGKAVTPYVAVGVLNDMGTFFDSLRDNLETLASLSPAQRGALLDAPHVVSAPATGGGGGGGMRKLHALRPLRPSGNIRSYNRRSFMEADGTYPGAYNHDPELLWTGLGR